MERRGCRVFAIGVVLVAPSSVLLPSVAHGCTGLNADRWNFVQLGQEVRKGRIVDNR